MTLAERQTALERFRKDSNVNVLLMTLGTGAIGLNLTVATRIHILEPQWNPLQESQAIGRAIRLGQKKQVTVVRYITRNSVETYIQCRQSKKLYLARLGWDADEDETEEAKLKKLADLKSLLSLENGTEASAVGQDGSVECEMADAP
ncbi:putative ATP-dependent helicase C23E6.02 [Lasiodiplodia hormozganensis]|uniref:ATP-dependent helicase C23E6.02 n=1 Tax=Lasiodiplodia hormozganensis TaxID=869390 RepID=A0AA40C268_9PEZI|nr:putative ATP-dependent helicase C23E6.02 [Lasiodiplodia hormozganensis]